MSKILIIDDGDKYFELCRRFMPEHGFLPPVRSYREAAAVLARRDEPVDLVLLDVHLDIGEADLLPEDKTALFARDDRDRVLERLRRVQGFSILDRIRRDHPDLPVIVMTGRDDLPIEVDAERLHAQDYTYLLDDEYLDARSLRLQVEGILSRRERAPAVVEPFYWGTTPAMLKLRRRLAILARGRLPIILQGATGTGKSLLARDFIHVHSARRGPFVAVDLSTVPTDLMAAHLFGVVKGAYTGAVTAREGVLARADGGTLFLDEIGNLSLELQKSLLLVLQEGQYRPVGSVEERVADVKIVVASNEDLPSLVHAGAFREDLYMRLNPSTAVTLPTLRERRDDFSEVLSFFMGRAVREAYNADLLLQYAQQRGLVPAGATSDAIALTVGSDLPSGFRAGRVHFFVHPSTLRHLQDDPWPGNFRQLEMVLSNLVTLTLVDLVDRVDQIEPGDPTEARRPDVIPILPRTVRELLGSAERAGLAARLRTEAEGTLHGAVVAPSPEPLPGGREPEADAVREVVIRVEPAPSLNQVSCTVERQYLTTLYERAAGDLGLVALWVLGDRTLGRKIQLRMNQLGLRLRSLRRGEA